MKTELDIDGFAKIAWAEFEPCLKIFSKTAPIYLTAKEKYHESIQMMLGQITHLEDRLKKYRESGPNELSGVGDAVPTARDIIKEIKE